RPGSRRATPVGSRRSWLAAPPGCAQGSGGFPARLPLGVALHAPLEDRPAPGAGGRSAAFVEGLELAEVALDAVRDDAERAAGLLDRALGRVVEAQGHARAVGPERLELHAAGVVRTRGAAPADVAVRLLMRDLGRPLHVVAADLGHPVQP